MMRHGILVVVLCAVVQAGETPEYVVYRLGPAPRIDGEVATDMAWKEIPSVSGFYILGDGYAERKQTAARAAWTESAFYIALECEEPDMELIHAKMTDGDKLWLEDGIEIFLMIPGEAGVFQFIVNTAGAKTMGEGDLKPSQWKAAAARGKDFWSAEVCIPVESLGVAPADGDVWAAAFCRNIFEYRSGGSKFTSWPRLENRFKEPEHFARLIFANTVPSDRQFKKQTLRLSAGYRKHLRDQIEEIRHALESHEAIIKKAATVDVLKEEADALLNILLQIRHIDEQREEPSLRELEAAARSGGNMQQRCRDLKYRYLMEELLQ